MAAMALETSVRRRTERAPRQNGGPLPVTPSAGFGRVTVVAGVEDTLAALRTAVLLARTFGGTLRLYVSGMESTEIHFGRARCEGLLAGLVVSLRERLARMASLPSVGLNVEIDFSHLPDISLSVYRADAALR